MSRRSVVLAAGVAEREQLRAALEAAGYEVVEHDPTGAGATIAPPDDPGDQGFHAALNAAPIALWTQDEDLRYVWAFNLPKGLEDRDAIGKTDADLFPADEAAALAAIKRQVLASGRNAREQVRLNTAAGPRTFDMHVRALVGGGLAGVMVDITETKQWDDRLRESQKLESIGVLAGGIAHDFNNLLTTILGNASLALDDLPPDNPARPMVDGIVRGAEQAARLTGQLLAYAGKGRFIIELLDLSEMVRRILSLIRSSLPKTTRLHVSLKPDLPPVAGDAAQLQQVAMNLIINAGEAIGEGTHGTVRINTGVQHLSRTYIERWPLAQTNELTPGDYVHLEVRDTGCGMDERTTARIFEPFFTTKFTGRGLGLAAVHGIVRAHHGTVELYSAPGRGTTFKVLFPVASGETRRQTAEAAPEEEIAGAGSVLVADDDELIREMVRAALERRGYSVLLAEDADTALAAFDQAVDQISAVLVDVALPGLNGPELVGYIRRRRPGVAVVLSTAYSELEACDRFGQVEPIVYITKPYTADRIVRTLAQACRAGLRPRAD